MSIVVLVVGPPRSGTSMTAGLLHAMGVNMGDALIPADPMNPTGFYVDEEFERAIARYFNASNFPDATTFAMPDDLAAEIRGLIEERESRGVDWGVKTTFGCALLRPMLDVGADVRVVRCRRAKADSRASLAAHTGHDAAKIEAMVDWFDNAAASCTMLAPSFEVDFAAMRANPTAGVAELAAFVGRESSAVLAAFVDPTMSTY